MIRLWLCRLLHGHRHIAFGGSSFYVCRKCLTEWPVPWAEAVARDPREARP